MQKRNISRLILLITSIAPLFLALSANIDAQNPQRPKSQWMKELQILREFTKAKTLYQKAEITLVREENSDKKGEGKQQMQEAIAALEEVINKYPQRKKSASARKTIGFAYLELKEYDQAIKHFQKVSEDYPDSTVADEATYMAGYAFARRSEYSDALKQFELVISTFAEKSNPRQRNAVPHAMFMKAEMLMKLGRQAEAKATYQEIIAQYPNHVIARRAKPKLK